METHGVFQKPPPPQVETHGVFHNPPTPSSYAGSSNDAVLTCFAVCCLSQTCVICCEGPHSFLKFKDEKKKEATKKTKGHKFARFSELIALNYLLINVTGVTFTFHL